MKVCASELIESEGWSDFVCFRHDRLQNSEITDVCINYSSASAVVPDLDQNCETTLMIFPKAFLLSVNFERKKSADDKKNMQNYPACK